MRFSTLFALKTFLCILLKTSAQCGFVIKCFITCLQFLTGHKAAFYRCRSDGELIGSIAYFAGQNSAPDGWLLCNGAAVSRSTYAALFSAVGATYGAGDGSTTFALPNLIDKFVEGSTTVGTTKAAGLPNIEGTIRPSVLSGAGAVINTGSGVFDSGRTTTVSKIAGNASDISYMNIDFDASRSSTIYGNSTTVQPPALTMKPFIYTGKTSVNKWLRTA